VRQFQFVARGGQGIALAMLCTLLFLTFLDDTVVSVALCDLQTSLRAGVTDLQRVVGAYALTFARIMLGCGMIGGRTRPQEGHAGWRRSLLRRLRPVRGRKLPGLLMCVRPSPPSMGVCVRREPARNA
jgi:hypothetical protein